MLSFCVESGGVRGVSAGKGPLQLCRGSSRVFDARIVQTRGPAVLALLTATKRYAAILQRHFSLPRMVVYISRYPCVHTMGAVGPVR